MRRTWRIGAFSVTTLLAVAAALGSVALACTYNMQGTMWFTGTPGGATITSARAGATVYSQASGLYTPNAAYEIRYVPLGGSAGLCHDSPLFLGPRTFTTNASGGWSNQAVALPALRGTYSMCAATVAATSAADQPATRSVSNWSSTHLTFTVT